MSDNPELRVVPDPFNTAANIVTWALWENKSPDEAARKILDAITPLLKADAWDEGYDAADYDAPHSIKTDNPYRPTK